MHKARKFIDCIEHLLHEALRLHICDKTPAMAADCMDHVIWKIYLLEKLRSFPAVLFREHFPVDIMKQSYDSPVLRILAILYGCFPHYRFHLQRMVIEAFRLVVFPE